MVERRDPSSQTPRFGKKGKREPGIRVVIEQFAHRKNERVNKLSAKKQQQQKDKNK